MGLMAFQVMRGSEILRECEESQRSMGALTKKSALPLGSAALATCTFHPSLHPFVLDTDSPVPSFLDNELASWAVMKGVRCHRCWYVSGIC